jgi:hypothetical protein
MTEADWKDDTSHLLGMLIRGDHSEHPWGRPGGEVATLLLLNGGGRSKPFTLPRSDGLGTWSEVLDTSGSQVPLGETRITLAPHSLVLLRR